MLIREMKALKVGDKVKLKFGDVEEMKVQGLNLRQVTKAIGEDPVVEVVECFDPRDQSVCIYHKSLGRYWFTQGWLEAYKLGTEVAQTGEAEAVAGVGVDSSSHPLAEVLTWVAQGKQVEYRHTYSQGWKILDTSCNFSFFADFEYRLYAKPEEPKYYWVFLNHDDTLSVSSFMTEQEADQLFGTYKQKVTI